MTTAACAPMSDLEWRDKILDAVSTLVRGFYFEDDDEKKALLDEVADYDFMNEVEQIVSEIRQEAKRFNL